MKTMKYIFIVLIFLFHAYEVSGEEVPLALVADYGISKEEVWIQIVAEQPVLLDSFTFAVTYNMDRYQLYKGNDLIPQGYRFNELFQNSYQNGGMMISNALDGKILFSGAHASSSEPFQGVIAEVSLLKYNHSETDNSDINLEIQNLHINGENGAEDTIKIPSTTGKKEESLENNFEKPNSSATEIPNNTIANTTHPEEQTIENPPYASETPVNSTTNREETQEKILAVTDEAQKVENQAGESNFYKEQNSSLKPGASSQSPKDFSEKHNGISKNLIYYVLAVVVFLSVVVACYFFSIRKKGNKDSKR